MHISGAFCALGKPDIGVSKPDIGVSKPDIGASEPDIGASEPDIGVEVVYGERVSGMTEKTISHIRRLYDAFGKEEYFGRSDVEAATDLKSSRASELLKELVRVMVIEPVEGNGKGKYRFIKN